MYRITECEQLVDPRAPWRGRTRREARAPQDRGQRKNMLL